MSARTKTKALQIQPSTTVQVSTPQEREQAAESWASLPQSQLKKRAIEAEQAYDRDALKRLLQSYLLTMGLTSKRTMSAYWTGASRLIAWCEEKAELPHDLDGDQMARFVASLESALDGSSTKAKTRQVYVSGAKAMIDALRWTGAGRGNPDPFVMANGRKVRIVDRTPVEDKPDPYTVDEVKKLLEGANDRERALILLGVDGGLRLAEMQALTWRGVDLKRGILKFMGKGSKDAKVTVSASVVDALTTLKGADSTGQVFKIGRRRLQQIFSRRCRDADVKPRGVHNLRHTCGTRLYEKTRDLLIVKRHLRHSSTVTSEIYAHLADKDYLKAVADLGDDWSD